MLSVRCNAWIEQGLSKTGGCNCYEKNVMYGNFYLAIGLIGALSININSDVWQLLSSYRIGALSINNY